MARSSLAMLCMAMASLCASCKKEGCLDGGSSCVVPAPCKVLRFDCDDDGRPDRCAH